MVKDYYFDTSATRFGGWETEGTKTNGGGTGDKNKWWWERDGVGTWGVGGVQLCRRMPTWISVQRGMGWGVGDWVVMWPGVSVGCALDGGMVAFGLGKYIYDRDSSFVALDFVPCPINSRLL